MPAPTPIFYPTPAETVPAQLSFQPRPGFPSQPYQTGPGQQYPSYPSVPTYNPNQNTDSSVAPGYPNAGVQSRPSIYNPHEHQVVAKIRLLFNAQFLAWRGKRLI